MKIAFTSCFDVLDDNDQIVWTEVGEQHPDVILLLGDSIYMDFGWRWWSDHPLGKPRRWGSEKFANEMYARYKAQSKVESFRKLIGSVSHVGAIWDDHDFAWNNCSGLGRSNTKSKRVVPHDKKLISRCLHMQFREWLQTSPLADDYPERPSMEEMLNGPDEGIQERFDVRSVRFLMLDGRYYREEKDEDAEENLTSMLGENQREWLANCINEWDGLSIICSGSTLASGSSGTWAQYLDLEWLESQHFAQTIVLSGDIHDIKMPKDTIFGNIWEFTASGAARPKIGGDSGNFGIINVSDEYNDKGIEVELYDEKGLDKHKRIVLE